MATDRALTKPESQAFDAAEREGFGAPFAAYSRCFEVSFPNNTDTIDVAHGLGAVPDGMLKLVEVGGTVEAVTPHLWSTTVAYLKASAANTRARVVFITLRESILDA